MPLNFVTIWVPLVSTPYLSFTPTVRIWLLTIYLLNCNVDAQYFQDC